MALNFDGTNDAVHFGDCGNALDGVAALTWMGWYDLDAVNTDSYLVQKGALALGAWAADLGFSTAGDIAVGIGAGYGYTSTGAVATGAWTHVAFVFDGSQTGDSNRLKLYVNAAAVAITTFAVTIPATTGSDASNVTVGSARGAFLNGRAAHLRAWAAALTLAEITQEMNSYRPVRTSGLQLWAPLDDGTTAADYSGNGNAGTLIDAPTQIAGPPVSYGGR